MFNRANLEVPNRTKHAGLVRVLDDVCFEDRHVAGYGRPVGLKSERKTGCLIGTRAGLAWRRCAEDNPAGAARLGVCDGIPRT